LAKADICLIRPPAVESFRFATTSISLPLGLAYISAAIKRAGFNVDIVDAVGKKPKVRVGYYKGYLVGMKLGDIAASIKAETALIGITVVFTHEWPAVVQLINLIKKRMPSTPIVIGGEHVTSMPEFCLKTSLADYVVMGEGEETIVELMQALESGSDLDKIPGIGYHVEDAININERRKRRTDIDDIAWPDWEQLDVNAYEDNRFVGGMYSERLTMPILATRGCPYQCTYCSAPNMWLPRWIPRDPVSVVDEIEFYINRFGAGNFPFQDLTAIIKKDWIRAFCEEILNRGLKFTWQLPTGTRSEAIDPDIARLLKASGMTSMAYAPESGSETTRRYIKKKMKTDRLFDSIDAAVSADLNVAAFIVIGFPHDEESHFQENLGFIDRLAEHGITDLSVGFYMALPGTELFHSLYDSGKIKLDRAYFRHILDSLALIPSQRYCDKLSRWDLFCWKSRFYRRFYGAKKQNANKQGMITSIFRAVRGFFSKGEHTSKLETAFYNGITSGIETFMTRFRGHWISKAEEAKIFDEWDEIYRNIREKKLNRGLVTRAPVDTRELHRGNVIAQLELDHGQARQI
jgi:radical SAM superfamily enzyme YgiQ (UPF0313 family)